MQHVKPLSQLTNDELEDLLDDESMTPVLAKKIENLLAEREEHTRPKQRVQESEHDTE